MLQRSDADLTLTMLVTDLALTDLALWIARTLRSGIAVGITATDPSSPYFHFPIWAFVVVPAIWGAVFPALSVYDRRRTLTWVDDIQVTIAAVSFATLVLAGIAYFLMHELSRALFIYFFVADLSLLVGWRVLLRALFRLSRGGWPNSPHRVVIVGAGSVARRIERALSGCPWAGISLVGFVDDEASSTSWPQGSAPLLGRLDDISGVVLERQIDDLVIALPLRAHDRLVQLVSEAQRLPVRVYVVPDLFDLAFFRTTVEEYNGIPMIGLREPAIAGASRLAKRLFDLVLTSLLLAPAVPIMAIVALAIKLDSPGPAIFRQQRVGENGKLFWMLKFRSMYQDAQKRIGRAVTQAAGGRIVHKRPNDPRVTRVGRLIRATSLDELPQLFNVVRGEMSLVGPRPELPWLVEQYEPWQRKRFCVPQGITGWWQVNGRSDKLMHLHTEEDLYYIQNYSLRLDLSILWRTLGAVLKRKGAF